MWLLSNGNSAPIQNFNIPPAVLYIADEFVSSDAGTYTCSPNNMLNDPSGDNITLNAQSEYVHSDILLLIFRQQPSTHQTHYSINVNSSVWAISNALLL